LQQQQQQQRQQVECAATVADRLLAELHVFRRAGRGFVDVGGPAWGLPGVFCGVTAESAGGAWAPPSGAAHRNRNV
jgi:hypothetical protein